MRHQRVGAAADRERAHDKQRDMVGSLRSGRGRKLRWLTLAECGGADLTFALHLLRFPEANVKFKAPPPNIFASGPLIPTFAKEIAATWGECWNWTTGRRFPVVIK